MRSVIDSASAFVRPLLENLATERGLAVNTLLAYRSDLEDAEEFLTARSHTWLTAIDEDYFAYLQSQSRAGMATKTVARRFAALRLMLLYLAERFKDEKETTQRIARALSRIERPKPERSLPKILSRLDAAKLIAAACNPASALFLRDIAIFELLYACGLRASEICGLRVRDVNLSERWLRAFGKGNKERIVPIGGKAIDALTRYLADCRPKLLASSPAARVDRLFISPSGRPLNRIRLYQIVSAGGRRAKLAKPISPHTLRHCFASHLLGGGADLRVVQDLLGHKNLRTTEVYIHLDQARLKGTHAKFHPRG